MSEILIAIALWCGNPGYGRLSTNDVNDCRQKILNCYIKEKKELVTCIQDVKL